MKCPTCGKILYEKDLTKNLRVCSHCAHHFRMSASERLNSMLDDRQWTEHDRGLKSTDPLQFTDTKPYGKRLKAGAAATGLRDAAISADGCLDGLKIVVVAMEYGFIGGSMGIVVGEKIARAGERALRRGIPLVIVCCSGGARMMEGTLSLMQMAKISAVLARLDRTSVPYIAVLTNPTTGGVTASFAMLADLQHRRAQRAHRIRRAEGDRANDSNRSSRRDSSGASSCWSTGC